MEVGKKVIIYKPRYIHNTLAMSMSHPYNNLAKIMKQNTFLKSNIN